MYRGTTLKPRRRGATPMAALLALVALCVAAATLTPATARAEMDGDHALVMDVWVAGWGTNLKQTSTGSEGEQTAEDAPGRTVVSARIHAIGDLDDGLAFMMGFSLGADGTGGIEHDAKFGYGFASSESDYGFYLVFGLGAGGVGISGDAPMPLPYKGYALIEGALQIIDDSEDRNWVIAGGYNYRRGGEHFPWAELRMGSGDDTFFSSALRFWKLPRGPLVGLSAGVGF